MPANYKAKADALIKLGVVGWTVTEEGEITYSEGTTPPDEDLLNSTIEEIAGAQPLNKLRAARDRRLAQTDWWVLPDRTPTQAQLDYRQALRDITDSYTSLSDVVWPDLP